MRKTRPPENLKKAFVAGSLAGFLISKKGEDFFRIFKLTAHRLFLAVFVAFGLSACEEAPIIGTPAYTYVAPHTPGGVLCVDQCHESFDFCHKVCAMEYHACVSDIQAAAQHEYEHYAKQQFDAHRPADRKPSDFEHTESCVDADEHCLSRCDTPYNSCYSACGGTVN